MLSSFHIKRTFTRTKMINFYEILRINKYSPIELVNEAYNNIKKAHEDERNELLDMVEIAYKTLSNKESKDEYDHYMKNDSHYEEKKWNLNDSPSNKGTNHKDNHINTEYSGSDIVHTERISIKDAYTGVSYRKIIINQLKYDICNECNGTGDGFSCKYCGGTGERVYKSIEKTVNIKEFTLENDCFLFKNEGNLYPNSIDKYDKRYYGDLIIRFSVYNEGNERLIGKDIVSSMKLSVKEALSLCLNENEDAFLTKTHHSLLKGEINMNIQRKDLVEFRYLIKKGGFYDRNLNEYGDYIVEIRLDYSNIENLSSEMKRRLGELI